MVKKMKKQIVIFRKGKHVTIEVEEFCALKAKAHAYDLDDG